MSAWLHRFGPFVLLSLAACRAGSSPEPQAAAGASPSTAPALAEEPGENATIADPADPGERYMALRIFPTEHPEQQEAALNAIARVAHLEKVTLTEPQSVEAFVANNCGGLPPPLRRVVVALVRRHNSHVGDSGLLPPGPVVLPPCPLLGPGGPIEVRPGANAWSHLTAAMGAAGCASMREVALRSGLAVNCTCKEEGCWEKAKAVLSGVSARTVLTIPFRSYPRQWRIRSPEGFDSDEFKQELDRLPHSGIVDLAFSSRPSRLRNARPVSHQDLGEAAGSCDAAARDARWPLDAEAIAERLRENADYGKLLQLRTTPVVIVADTGLSPTTPAIEPFLSVTESERTPNFLDDDDNGYFDDSYGFRAELRRGPPDPYPELSDAEHGTHVAGAVAGVSVPALETLLRGRLRLRVVNIASKRDGSIPGGSIFMAMSYGNVENVGAKLVNVSVAGFLQDPAQAKTNLRVSTYPLVVAAAGNDGREIGRADDLFPGAFRHPDLGALVVVAAHGPDGRLLRFSNYGRRTVDLAAPGCAVPTVDGQGRAVRKDGTSLAAPIVTLVAGLLFSEGLTKEQVRTRLLSSVDFDPTLRDQLISGGRLNAARALSVYHDEITRSDGKVVRGRITNRAFQFRHTEVQLSKLARVVGLGNGRVLVLLNTGGLELDEEEVIGPSEMTVQTVPGRPDSLVRVAVRDVKDIVFRTRDWPECARKELNRRSDEKGWYSCPVRPEGR